MEMEVLWKSEDPQLGRSPTAYYTEQRSSKVRVRPYIVHSLYHSLLFDGESRYQHPWKTA